MSERYFRELAEKVKENGYAPIPLSRGKKFPTFKGWQNADWATARSNSTRSSGVGLLCRVSPCVDIDVDVPELVEALVTELPGALIRVGRAPRVGAFFRWSGEPGHKRVSATFVDLLGDEHKIEILGDGQQAVAYHVHPETGQPYRWLGRGGPADVPLADLPELTDDLIERLFARWEVLAPGAGLVRHRAAQTPAAVKALQPAGPETEDLLLPRLAETGCEPWQKEPGKWELRRCPWANEHGNGQPGGAVYFQAGHNGAAAGFKCLHAACSERTIADLRRVLGADTEPLPVMRQEGAVDSPLLLSVDEMQRELVLIGGSHVVRRSQPGALMTVTAAQHYYLPAYTLFQGRGRVKKQRHLGMWIEREDRVSADRLGFNPRFALGEIYQDNELCFNTFVPIGDGGRGDKAHGEYFAAHVRKLIPDQKDAEWMLSWLAHIVQRPEDKAGIAPLLITPTKGTGRGWVGAAMKQVLGRYCATVSFTDLIDSSYNSWLNRTLLVEVEELALGGGWRSTERASAKLRDMLTATRVTVNEKFIPQYSIESYTRFYLQSNLVDALHVAENERRIYAMDCTRTPLTPGEGAERYGRLDDPAFARGVLAWLMDRPLAGFNPHGFAPYTDAFKALIDSRYSDQDIEVAEAIIAWRRVSAITTASAIHSKVSVTVNPQTIAHRLRDANATVLGRGRMTTGDAPERIWCLSDPDKWKTVSMAKLKAEFNKGWQHLRIV